TTAAARARAAVVCATGTSGTVRSTCRFNRMTTTGAREARKRIFPTTAPRRASWRSPTRAALMHRGTVIALARVVLLAVVSCGAVAGAFEPRINYMLQCMGCHTPDGSGTRGRIPSVKDTLVPLARSPEGRRFLIQVPGVSQSALSNGELAELVNWMISNLSVERTDDFERFTAAEVGEYRRDPLVNVRATRERLLGKPR